MLLTRCSATRSSSCCFDRLDTLLYDSLVSLTCSSVISESAPMTYNLTRHASDLLDKYGDAPASLSIQLYPDHWTLNSGSKFLYNSPAAVSFLCRLILNITQ